LWRNLKLFPINQTVAPLAAHWALKYVTCEMWKRDRPWRFLKTGSLRPYQSETTARNSYTDRVAKSYRVNDESMCHKWYCIIELVDTDKCILFWSDSNRINIFEYSFQNIKILANSILIINYAFHNWLIWREFPFVWPWF